MNLPYNSNSYWIDSVSTEKYPALSEDINVDVAIVGGGITGINCAYLLKKQGLKVAVLESDRILAGTTGHTTAKITIHHGLVYDKYIKHFGEEKAKIYGESNQQAVRVIKDIIDENKIDCDFEIQSNYIYTQSDEYISKIENEVIAMNKLGFPASYTTKLNLPFDVKAAVQLENQAQFHPRKYLSFIASAVNKEENCIFEKTKAIDIENVEMGFKKLAVIVEGGKKVNCDYVVIASHFPFYDGMGLYFARMYPERSYALAVKTKKEFECGMYINAEEPARSIRYTPIKDGKLVIFGGEHHKTGHETNTMVHFDNLFNFADSTYGVQEVMYRWSTQDLMTLDDMPYIGHLTSNHKNIFVATGFRKWGMTTSMVSALLIKNLIVDKESPWEEVYTPSRFSSDPSLKNLLKDNANVAKELIKGKLKAVPDTFADLKLNEGKTISIDGNKVGAYRDEKGKVHLVDTTCKHFGCEVQWNNAEKSWDCPCHGSRYSIDGEAIEGPTLKSLDKVDVDSDDVI